jgi:hypothetical protein
MREERGEEREAGRAREESESGKGRRERRSEEEKERGRREREGRGGEERRRKGLAMFLLLQVICRYERVKNWVTPGDLQSLKSGKGLYHSHNIKDFLPPPGPHQPPTTSPSRN